MGGAHNDDTWAAFKGGEAQATKLVSDELEVPKLDGFVEGKAITWGMLTSGNRDEHRWWNHHNDLRKARGKSPFLVRQQLMFFALARYRVVKIMCSCFEVVLQTMKNSKAHYSLSWFRPLLWGNRPTSSVFVLEKKNSVTKGVSWELEMFTKCTGEMFFLSPRLKGRGLL
jgi:hypothetical protein